VRHVRHISLVLKIFSTFQKKFQTVDIGIKTKDLTMNDSRTAAARQLYDRRHFISVIIIQEEEVWGGGGHGLY
jgi:hypothetical protein